MNQQQIISLGIIVVFIGIIIILFSSLFNKSSQSESKVAVVGFIGFIPFGFGNKKLVLVGIVSTIFFLFFYYWFVKNQQ